MEPSIASLYLSLREFPLLFCCASPSSPFVFELSPKFCCASQFLYSYAAKLAGLYPTDPLQALKVDEVVAILDELWNKIGATHKDKPETREAYGLEVAPKYLTLLTTRLGAGPFFHGETPGWADLWVYQYIAFFTSGFFDFVPKDFVAKASPTLAAFAERVKASELYVKYGTPE